MVTKLGYDIDGVLADFSGHFFNNFDLEDKSEQVIWGDKRILDNIHHTYDDRDFWLSIPSMIHPQDLSVKPHCYITSRPIPIDWTMEWLWKHGFPHAPLYSIGNNVSKIESFIKSGATHFVDDAPHNFEELNSNGIICFLKDRPYNREVNTHLRIKELSDLPMALINQINTF